MKLTDALAEILKENSVNQVFGLQGGAVVHIFDSIEKKKNRCHLHKSRTISSTRSSCKCKM